MEKVKRVLHIMGGMNRAGAETMIMNIYRVLDKKKFQFDFLVYSDEQQDYEEEIKDLGGRVIHMPFEDGIGGLFKTIGGIRKVVKEYGPYCAIHAATLHNSMFGLLAVCNIPNCRRIVHSHSTGNIVNPSIPKRIYNFVSKYIIRALTQDAVACGEEAGEYLFGKRKFLHKGIIVNNSVDIDRFYDVDFDRVDQLRKEFEINNEFVIGSVARLQEVKNHRRMLEIVSVLKRRGGHFKLILVGRGELETELQELTRQLGLEDNVVFAGIRSDIPELMHLFDIFLMPSHFEGNPVTLIEAQASGLPSLISDSITDKIDLGLGLIHRISLSAGNNEWVERILSIKRPYLSKHTISAQLRHNGYDLMENTSLLCRLYTNV